MHHHKISPTAGSPARCNYGNLVELTRCRAQEQPARKAFVFLREGEVETDSLTFAALDDGARAMATTLREHFQPGERVLLSYPAGLEFIIAFFGCLYAGVIAVPAYPPTGSTDIRRIETIAADSGAAGVCVARSGFDGTRTAIAASPLLRRLIRVSLPDSFEEPASTWTFPELRSDTLAFLQYTSGSTGAPKGVMVSHGNVLHNQRLIEKGFGFGSHTVGVSWLPLYHDMGLIGTVLQTLYLGITSVVMSPVAFAAKPARWLQAISDYRATSSGGPNFAYELCVRRVTADQMLRLDLSSWKVAFVGAETVQEETLLRFADKFAICGFRRGALTSCYGMAEATLFVTASSKGVFPPVRQIDSLALQQHRVRASDAADNVKPLSIVSCGGAIDQEIAIVDPRTCLRCPTDQTGEIWIRGPSVAQGYWNNPRESVATFAARIADSGDGPYLRTGDMGFIERAEVFVTGRVQDLITIRGRIYNPHDIEATVRASHPALSGGTAAAFSVELHGEQRLVVAHEIHRHVLRRLLYGEVLGAARSALMSELGLRLSDLVLLKQGSLPLTSSGKIRRVASREAYLLRQEESAKDHAAASELAPLSSHAAPSGSGANCGTGQAPAR